MKILVLTSLFPNNQQPLFGIFVKKRIVSLTKFCKVIVVAPIPWAPLAKVLWDKYKILAKVPSRELLKDMEVLHPRFIITPKIGRSLYGFMYFFSLMRFIKEVAKKHHFDILDVHWGYPDGFAGVLLGKLLRKPVVVTVRGTDINLYPKYFLRRKLITYALKNADLVIAVCDALKDAVVKLGIPKTKVRVIPNGVDTERFYPIGKERARKELGLPLEKKIVLSVGHLIHRKGFHHLIDAVYEIVKDSRDGILLVIVGEGEYRKKLEDQVKRLNMGSFVKLVGAKPNEELYKWYSSADIFCLASSREGWPNVILEAFACGLPVVATRIWGTPEVVCSEDYGFLVDDQNGRALATAILKAFEKDWDVESIESYARVNTWEKGAEKVFMEFNSILKRNKTGSKVVRKRAECV